MIVLAEAVYRIGRQQLLKDGGRYFVTIRNRSYASRVEIPAWKAPHWAELLIRQRIRALP